MVASESVRGFAMADVFKLHEVARIRNGRHAGLVGTVTDQKTEGGKQVSVRVQIEGVKDGEGVSAHAWFKRSQLERNHGA